MFGWFRRKPKQPEDPLAAYDGALEELRREGEEIRRSAATLIALRSELRRTVEQTQARLASLRERADRALESGDASLAATFSHDELQARLPLQANEEALARAEADASLLEERARAIQERTALLEAERNGARAQLAMGQAVRGAYQLQADRFRHAVALDAARDEVERAHALAELYRDERDGDE